MRPASYPFSRTNREVVIANLRKLDAGRVWRITVEEYRERRNHSQNDRLWALHRLAAEATGMSPEDMHEAALCRFYGFEEKRLPSGYVKQVPLERSSGKDKEAFAKFMTSTEAWYIQDFGVWLEQEAA
jgi:hypothetical protein